MPLLRELIEIPRSLPANRFVLKLSEGVLDPERTLRDYIVTEQIGKSFDAVLGVIGDSLSTRAGNGTYLRGSFGAGKSHFMAVLHLILNGNLPARSIPELAAAIHKYNDWMTGKKSFSSPTT